MAHLGVLAVLDSLGITPDLIVGTSAGAVLGAMWASGETAASIEARVRAARLDRIVRPYSPSLGPAFASARPQFVWERAGVRWVVQDGAVRDEEADSALARLLAPAEVRAGGDFDALPIPFRAVATDLRTREVVVLDRGRLVDAVRASMAIPVLLRPVPREGRTLVDGGLSANNPVAVARALGARRIIVATIASPVPDVTRLDDPLTVASAVFEFLFLQDPMSLGDSDVRIALPTATYGMLDFRPSTLDTLIALGRTTATAALTAQCVRPLTATPTRVTIPVTTTDGRIIPSAPSAERIGLAIAYDHALSAQAWSLWTAPPTRRGVTRSVELTVAPWSLRIRGTALARRAGASLDLSAQRLPTFIDRREVGGVQADDALLTIGRPRATSAGWQVDGGLVGWAGRSGGVDGRADAGLALALTRRRPRDPAPALQLEGIAVSRWHQLTMEARPRGALGVLRFEGRLLASVGTGVPLARRPTLGGLEGFTGRPLLSARGDHLASLALRTAWPLRPRLRAEVEPMIGRVGEGGFGRGSDPAHGILHRGLRVGLAVETPLGTLRVSEGFAADGGRAAYVRFGDWR
ncbi:MAG: patatin-like phospholipase family protein [Gemmatimonadetes bacterium]|nr:patatin-like phospholipase family protein [Gemmatimonadota bacterium]